MPLSFILLGSRLLSSKKHFSSVSNLQKLLVNMPKDKTQIAEAQRQRTKIKEKLAKYAPSKVSLQVLGTGAEGAPRSLYIFSDQARYLFNCGEGTQRLAHEHKMKLAKLEHIFITQSTWKNIGGLPGTALTIQDVGVPKITLHGPDGLFELFRAARKFVVMKNMKVEMANCDENDFFEDNVMSVNYIPLNGTPKNLSSFDQEMEFDLEPEFEKNTQAGSSLSTSDESTTTHLSRKRRRSDTISAKSSTKGSFSDDDTDYYSHESKTRRRYRSSSVSGRRTIEKDVLTEAAKLKLAHNKIKATVMCYVCRLKPRPGALNLDKCVSMGVPAGPLLGELKNGNQVTLPSGKVVRPEEVCEPDEPGPVFLVVDCPSEEYLDALIGSTSLNSHNKFAKSDEELAYLVVHFTASKVVHTERYQKWMDNFSPSTQHLFINDGNNCMGSIAVHRIQYKLNLLSKDMFPLLGDKGTWNKAETKICNDGSNENVNCCIQPKTFYTFHLRPRKGQDGSSEVKLQPSEYIDETYSLDGFCDELTKLRIQMNKKFEDLSIREYPKVLFLGTGSCIPNKTRNTSGTLLFTNESNNILIDCGEGTYGQIIRFFGEQKARKVLADISAVYVSHLHADHHIGLIGFMQGRSRARKLLGLRPKPIYLLAPKQILSWLSFYDMGFEDVHDKFDLVANQDLLLESHDFDQEKKNEVLNALDMENIATCFVRHCPNAFGVAFTLQEGSKITYSGDTMPSDNLVNLGANSDLLIHEATMEDDLADEAVVKMHSTTSQAIKVGQKMNAKNILLTHFSQRYAKLPRFNENFTDNVGIAFDNMIIAVDELPLVPLLYPSLKIMFADHYEGMECKAVKRQKRKETILTSTLSVK